MEIYELWMTEDRDIFQQISSSLENLMARQWIRINLGDSYSLAI